MDLKVASGANLQVTGLAAGVVEFSRLRMEDLGTLQGMISTQPDYVTIFDLARYAETHTGCDQVLLLSRRRIRPAETLEDVRGLAASLLDRVQLARLVMAESLTTKEEKAMPEGKAGGPGTGPASAC